MTDADNAGSSIGVRDIARGLQALGLTRDSKVIVHASLSSLGKVRGGARAVLAAVWWTCDTLVMPAFTWQSLVWPLVGPPGNGMTYNDPDLADRNRTAQFFHRNLPVHPAAGTIAETLRRQPVAERSPHPALSFVAAGRHAREALAGQSIDRPLAPVEWLQQHEGDVVLIGVGHTCNISLHWAEQLAGRKPFTRWAIVRDDDSPAVRAVRLLRFPGCSDGFDAIDPEIARITRSVSIGEATVRRIPLAMLIPVAVGWISEDPGALLCDRPDCQRCSAVRQGGRLEGAG